MSNHDTMDVLTGFAVILAMLAVFAASVLAVSWWDTTWAAAVDPTRSYICRSLRPFAVFDNSFMVVVAVAGCRVT